MEKKVEARVAWECDMGDQRDDDIVFGKNTQTGSTEPKLQYNEPHNDAMPIYGFESRGGCQSISTTKCTPHRWIYVRTCIMFEDNI